MNKHKTRCEWAGSDPVYIKYHDTEWGVPVHDDRKLFEFLILEGAQAGLSWVTILKKRENYIKAFDNFDPVKVSSYNSSHVQKLLLNKGIIRNRLKIQSAIKNAGSFLKVIKEFGSFDNYIWQFTEGKVIKNAWGNVSELPSETKESRFMSKDLKKRGFSFIGPTICYAFMQAIGMVNDHTIECFRYSEVE
ncbi:MAG: DNA-3-methyladenine glycosylase I [Desulfobacterales bacterium]|jgi:DNA-3-methyladenine glycosylase I|nr:DNA-3-methyladenine glycosylase I [Desulfobacteraceae bacterium]MBT4363964.1 DNA-3-methyladenine glycosylase I [Desulfobacteraceae bacterium]MBT7085163.1 DNA-3-methyladenine glycosylase I [Desulfobacterales bacterium]MBT7696397.1 DNA-3-methyladenine glycosylase I [Desulfobacterales bacterium]